MSKKTKKKQTATGCEPHQGNLEGTTNGCDPIWDGEPVAPDGFTPVPGNGITMREEYTLTPSVRESGNGNNYYPGSETLGEGEMRVSFCGTAPFPPRIKQAGTCIMVELGEDSESASGLPRYEGPIRRFFFDLGPGCSKTIAALQIPFGEVNNIFLSHLHGDHIAELGYYYCFGPYSQRWIPFKITGPNGHLPGKFPESAGDDGPDNDCVWEESTGKCTNSEHDCGTRAMVTGMEEMYKWHKDAFQVFPTGDGFIMDVHEFNHLEYHDVGDGVIDWDQWDSDHSGSDPDWMENRNFPAGVCYHDGRVTVYHWPRSHAKDGASAYRLEWKVSQCSDPYATSHPVDCPECKTLKMVWTGDGRPDTLTKQLAAGVDLLISECQTDTSRIMFEKYGIPAEIYEYTIDTHHTVHYAVGDLMAIANPRLGMITHAEYDHDLIYEVTSGIRAKYQGQFALGIPDGVVVNLTKDALWCREAALPDYTGAPLPSIPFFEQYQAYYETVKDTAEWRHESNLCDHQVPIPNPINKRSDIQSSERRKAEVEPCQYMPEPVNRSLNQELDDDMRWPVDGTLVDEDDPSKGSHPDTCPQSNP